MKQNPSRKYEQLTRAELEVMQFLWARKQAFVSELIEMMPDPKPAYNTVSTIIRILERKGIVGHEAYGRSHRYHPLVDKRDYTHRFMQGVVGNFFGGSVSQMFSFFSEKEELSLRDIEEIISIAKEVKARKQNQREE